MINTDPEHKFLGRGWSFPPEFDRQSKSVKMVSDVDDIEESLKILLSTSPQERVMQPDYGCGLKDIIFENLTESSITEIKDVIERAVLFFEPRITLDSIDIDSEKIYDGLIKIQLNYTVRTTNTRSNIVYPFYFNEGTNIKF